MPEYTRPWLAPYQLESIFCPERYALIEASTKSGKTVGCIAWLFEQAIQGQPAWEYWWVAPVYPQAEIAYRRFKRAVPQEFFASNETDMTISLRNGTVIRFKSGEKPDNLYGEDVHAAVIDEATRCREDAWHAIRSTLTHTQGPIRIIGNVKGRRNWAYQLARRAEAGETGMHYQRITAADAIAAGILTQDEIDDAQRMLPEAVYRELYLAEPSDDGGNPFGLAAIAACVGPMSSADPYCWGWDVARKQDYTVGIALDEAGNVCAFQRFQKPWEESYNAICQSNLGLMDSTGVGDVLLERIQRTVGTNIEGYHYTQHSKQQLMEGLAAAIQGREVMFPEGPIRIELESFEYVYTRTGYSYSAPEGMYDDCVNALALAVECWRRNPPVQPAIGYGRRLPERTRGRWMF